MLKFQITLIAILICSIAFVACERTQDALNDVMMMDPAPEMMPEMDDYRTWQSVDLPAPTMTVDEAKAAMNAAATGQAHGTGIRTVYFNEAAVMAMMGATAYPDGAMIVKDVMNEDNTEVVHVATMTKTDDPMYAEHNGWMYGVGGNQLSVANAMGCHSCHVAAGEGNDSVFVKIDDGTDDTDDGGTNGNDDS